MLASVYSIKHARLDFVKEGIAESEMNEFSPRFFS